MELVAKHTRRYKGMLTPLSRSLIYPCNSDPFLPDDEPINPFADDYIGSMPLVNLDGDDNPYGSHSGQHSYHPVPGWAGGGVGYPGGQAHTVVSGYVNPFVSRSPIYPCNSYPFLPYSGSSNPFADNNFGAPRRNNRNSMPPYPPYPPYHPYPPYAYAYHPAPG